MGGDGIAKAPQPLNNIRTASINTLGNVTASRSTGYTAGPKIQIDGRLTVHGEAEGVDALQPSHKPASLTGSKHRMDYPPFDDSGGCWPHTSINLKEQPCVHRHLLFCFCSSLEQDAKPTSLRWSRAISHRLH
jgi:hypothetical protein